MNGERYLIVRVGEKMDATDSFGIAVAVAKENKWDVFDTIQTRIVYDGARDELCLYHTIDAYEIEKVRDKLTELLEKGA